MGADGGVTWMRVTDPVRFWELIRPLGFTGSLNDGYEDDHDKFLTKKKLPADYVVLPYGTNHDLDGFGTLRELVGFGEAPRDWNSEVDETWTIADVVLDMFTKPVWYGYGANPFEETLYRATSFGRTLAYRASCVRRGHFLGLSEVATEAQLRGELEDLVERPVFKMTIQEWAVAVRAVLDWKTYDREETWT
jgi:hypothetical protein